MPVTMITYQRAADRRLMDQAGEVLDPLAREHHVTAPRTPRPIVRRAWREAFRAELTSRRCAPARPPSPTDGPGTSRFGPTTSGCSHAR